MAESRANQTEKEVAREQEQEQEERESEGTPEHQIVISQPQH